MRVTLTQEKLSAALQSVGRVAGRNSSLPILANVLIRASENRVLVSATNLELAISEYIGAKVETEGEITVPARLLADYIQNLPSTTIELTTEDNTLHIKAGTYTSNLYGISASDFPSIPDISGNPNVVMNGSRLKEAINEVAGAASSDETRPILTGVNLNVEDKSLTLAATDSYRLAERVVNNVTTTTLGQVIVPSKSLQELQRLIRADEKVAIYIDEGQIKCTLEERELVSRLVDGNYPDYRQLIPSENQTSVTVETDELLRITKIASLFAKDTAGSVTLAVSEKDQNIELKSVAAQVGDNSSVISVESATGEDSITFNARYLIDALNVFPSKKITLSFNGKLAPCILRPAGKDQQEYLYIVMPLRS